jgi:Holliday junction resolvase
MTNASKAKGTAAERAVVDYLRMLGFDCWRTPAGATLDCGDIVGIPGVCIQVKNQKTMDLGVWMNDLEEQMANAGASFGILVVKRRNKSNPADWYWLFHGSALTPAIAHLMRSHLDRKGA